MYVETHISNEPGLNLEVNLVITYIHWSLVFHYLQIYYVTHLFNNFLHVMLMSFMGVSNFHPQ